MLELAFYELRLEIVDIQSSAIGRIQLSRKACAQGVIILVNALSRYNSMQTPNLLGILIYIPTLTKPLS
jgi:hypothetical protein